MKLRRRILPTMTGRLQWVLIPGPSSVYGKANHQGARAKGYQADGWTWDQLLISGPLNQATQSLTRWTWDRHNDRATRSDMEWG